ncbi:MAG: RagB/SusD family nutrient uptake outer membrane protein [Flavobacteriaceae bacterium]|nr:RagB/SusD family nutrient uptake outer membrane protein [Flavobacteriaceae bacterium]
MKIKLILALLVSTFMFQGCDDDLEIAQNDNITSENLYNTSSGALAGLAGIYSRIGQVYKSAAINGQYPTNSTDEGHYNRKGTSSFLKNNFTPSDPQLTKVWALYYEAISGTNAYLTNLKNASLEESDKKEFLAEVHFLRAFVYFDLQKAFGGLEGIPMPLEDTAKQLLPRTPGLEVYKQIISDLEFAEEFLPSDAETTPGRAGKGVARGLLAKVYLYIAGEPFNEPGSYEKSRAWSKKVMDDQYHELNPSYQDVFDQLAMENYDKKEVLFQIGYSFATLDSNQSSKLGSVFGQLVHDEACGKGYSVTYATISLVLKYRSDPSDERGLWNASPYYIPRNNDCNYKTINNQFTYAASKYRRNLEANYSNTSFGSHHWPVLRYSDVLLMFAEAENKLAPGSQQALDALNTVRNRAKATPVTVITDEVIQEERMLELCFEGQRKYDLIRWGLLTSRVAETKSVMEFYAGNANFTNEDWTIYGEPNLGPDGVPQSGDEPTDLNIRTNNLHGSFNYYDGYNDYDSSKHKWLPIPEQEIGVNSNLKQSAGW